MTSVQLYVELEVFLDFDESMESVMSASFWCAQKVMTFNLLLT